MQDLTDITPYVRAAHLYNYRGERDEQRRRGYGYACHLFIEGHGHMLVEDQCHPISNGTLIFVRPGVWHLFEHAPMETMDAYNIYFDLWTAPAPHQPNFAYEWDQYQQEWMTAIRNCKPLDLLPTSMSLRSYPHLIDLMKLTLAAFNQQGAYTQEAAALLLKSWLLQWAHIASVNKPIDERIAHVVEEMDNHPETRASHEEWCAISGLEKSQFYRLFKQEMGITPKAYLLDARMKKACVLLMESRQNITHIALELGYDSIHYFTNQFRAKYGISPSEYRLGRAYHEIKRFS
ncbi:helix-turn-helix transcriptional regulator [Paenibacillus aquistagni]|uniref:helix-turn-helix transcriptional regulator n=1 Tax=Paenibacillus aquistagni TaxID=1852522 RepID=UPI00145AF8A0|nr:AraC family transcriptional regulator [Paenibacillus aquistagni]NMM51797.1 helix-turn-helix transcriptional regulator [Paenibacillus aquistagni]